MKVDIKVKAKRNSNGFTEGVYYDLEIYGNSVKDINSGFMTYYSSMQEFFEDFIILSN